MIPVAKLTNASEPKDFDSNCRKCGNLWLAAHPDKDPHEMSSWWSQFKPDLAAHFGHRCGWSATTIGQLGLVDHYLSCGPRQGKPSPHRALAFEWTNYRYAGGTINSRKDIHDDQILDPCEVESGWFEVILDGFLLRITDAIPASIRAKAEFTVEKLDLFRGFESRWTRWNWYKRYWNDGQPLMDLLRQDAPLVAAAVEKAIALGQELPDPNETEPAAVITPRKREYAPRPNRAKKKPDPKKLKKK